MAGSENEDRSKANVDQILLEFDGKRDDLTKFAEKTKGLIQALLEDAKIRFQSIQGRVKDREKLRRKYLDETKNYSELDDITDQVALRIITYYEDEVDRVAEIIKREFEVDAEKSVDKRETEPNKFGYYALNFVCRFNGQRGAQAEYRKFAKIFCEIQIVSILRHAWSEIEHPWYDLKPAYPDSIKRRFARMAALLEIAESEFLNLRQSQSDYRRSVAVQVEANVPDLPISAVSMKVFIEQEPLVAEIDLAIATALGRKMATEISDKLTERRSRAARLAGIEKLQEIRDLLLKYKAVIPRYSSQCRREVWMHIPPSPQLGKGVSIYHLSQMLANLRGVDATTEFFKAYGFNPDWNIARQVQVARKVVGN